MAVPKFIDFMKPVLHAIKHEGETKVKDICPLVIDEMKLTQEDLEQMIPSRKKYTYKDRIDWAIQYLKNAGLIERISHGTYRLTSEGERALESGKEINLEYLEQFDSFKHFHGGSQTLGSTLQVTPVEFTPQESMDAAYKTIHDELAKSLLKEIMGASPDFFEKLVVDLLLAMGYGYDSEQAGIVTGKSGDEGIDGIINEDKLGFSQIYVQAKRWNIEHKVGSPDIQTFAGALATKGATKGLYITTSQFTPAAKNVANKAQNPKVILVDGQELAKLMIAHGVGVSKRISYTIMQIDNDYFEE